MTTWYRDGTVTLTNGSKAVTGVGTEWIAYVLPGGIFFTPTGLYEVESVATNGSMQLVSPYAGPTVAGTAYAIAPTQGYITALSKQLGAVLANFGSLKDAWVNGTLAEATDLLDKIDASVLAGATGTEKVGNGYGATPAGEVLLPANPLTVFVRSSPIPFKSAVTGNFMGDASVDYSTTMANVLKYLGAYGGGQIILPPNARIKMSNQDLTDGIDIYAHDWTTIIEPVAGTYAFSVNKGSGGGPDPDTNKKNIQLRGMRILGKVVSNGFSEHVHLINLNAASWVLLEDVDLAGFQGDGVYLGSSNVGGLERHNENITLRRVRIDGVNRDNRNGISVIDCTNLILDDVRIRRTTRSNMPAAIDIEPDALTFHRIKNVSMTNIDIRDCRGGVFWQVLGNLTDPIDRVSLSGFRIQDCDEPLAIVGSYNTTPLTKATPPQNMLVEHGSCKGGVTPLITFGQRGLMVRDVSFENFTNSATVGSGGFDRVLSFGVTLRDTKWLRCGTTSGSAVKVDGITGFEYIDNEHMDCGDGTTNGAAVELAPSFPGALTVTRFCDNVFDKAAFGSMQAVKKTGGGTVLFDYQDIYRNRTNNQASYFLSDRETTYLPTVVGSSAAGAAASYSKQLGSYVRRGKRLFVTINLTWTGHTGAGAMLVTLPVASLASAPNAACAIAVQAIAYTAGKTIRAQVIAGQATIQLLQEAPGAALDIVPMSAAGLLILTVEYAIA